VRESSTPLDDNCVRGRNQMYKGMPRIKVFASACRTSRVAGDGLGFNGFGPLLAKWSYRRVSRQRLLVAAATRAYVASRQCSYFSFSPWHTGRVFT
jgi:hypothetical protein